MNRWQDSLKTGMDLIPVLVFMGLNSMLRGILAPELEKRLGRKLTDWEWEYSSSGKLPESGGGIPTTNHQAVATVVS